MKNRQGMCKFDPCPNEVWHEELGCCYTCYRGLLYWRGRPVAHKRQRLNQLKKLEARMETMITKPRIAVSNTRKRGYKS